MDINNIKIFVVGNKNDKYEEEEVKKDVAEEFAKSINATIRYVSAMNGSGIKELFDTVGRTFSKNDEESNNSKESKESKESKVIKKTKKKNNKQFSLKPGNKEMEQKNSKKRFC